MIGLAAQRVAAVLSARRLNQFRTRQVLEHLSQQSLGYGVVLGDLADRHKGTITPRQGGVREVDEGDEPVFSAFGELDHGCGA